jgi:hypothetical protein
MRSECPDIVEFGDRRFLKLRTIVLTFPGGVTVKDSVKLSVIEAGQHRIEIDIGAVSCGDVIYVWHGTADWNPAHSAAK